MHFLFLESPTHTFSVLGYVSLNCNGRLTTVQGENTSLWMQTDAFGIEASSSFFECFGRHIFACWAQIQIQIQDKWHAPTAIDTHLMRNYEIGPRLHCVLFSFYRSIWAVGCSASPAAATCGQPGRPDLPLGYVWRKKPAFTGEGKPCWCQILSAEKHMENCSWAPSSKPEIRLLHSENKTALFPLADGHGSERFYPQLHRWFHLRVVIWPCILMQQACAGPCLEKEAEIVAGRFILLYGQHSWAGI